MFYPSEVLFFEGNHTVTPTVLDFEQVPEKALTEYAHQCQILARSHKTQRKRKS